MKEVNRVKTLAIKEDTQTNWCFPSYWQYLVPIDLVKSKNKIGTNTNPKQIKKSSFIFDLKRKYSKNPIIKEEIT